MGEIKSAMEIAQEHVVAIEQSNSEEMYHNVSRGCSGNQAEARMREVFALEETVMRMTGEALSRDIEKVLLMAEEFERWDKQA